MLVAFFVSRGTHTHTHTTNQRTNEFPAKAPFSTPSFNFTTHTHRLTHTSILANIFIHIWRFVCIYMHGEAIFGTIIKSTTEIGANFYQGHFRPHKEYIRCATHYNIYEGTFDDLFVTHHVHALNTALAHRATTVFTSH